MLFESTFVIKAHILLYFSEMVQQNEDVIKEAFGPGEG